MILNTLWLKDHWGLILASALHSAHNWLLVSSLEVLLGDTILHKADSSVMWLRLALWVCVLKLELNKIYPKCGANGLIFNFLLRTLHVDPFCFCHTAKRNNHSLRPQNCCKDLWAASWTLKKAARPCGQGCQESYWPLGPPWQPEYPERNQGMKTRAKANSLLSSCFGGSKAGGIQNTEPCTVEQRVVWEQMHFMAQLIGAQLVLEHISLSQVLQGSLWMDNGESSRQKLQQRHEGSVSTQQLCFLDEV